MKNEYSIMQIQKKDCVSLLMQHHYLSTESKGFKSGVNVGLFHRDELVGICIFTGLPVPELAVGMFGLDRQEQSGLWELSRLCLRPDVQETEHNLASWFVSRAVRFLRKVEKCRAILSYADTRHHQGIIYKACNFSYCGLTAKKKDWYVNGTKAGRGKAGIGEWLDRPQKHRFVMMFDKKLHLKWPILA